MKRLIIYDLDGTLVNTAEDIAQSVNHTLQALQMPPMPVMEVRRHIGRGLDRLLRDCLRTDDAHRLRQGRELFEAHYADHLVEASGLYPGVARMLRRMAPRIQAVVTNKPDPFATDLLRQLEVARYFAQIIPGNGGHPKKPHPSSIRWLLRQHQVDPVEAVLIGDSAIDVQAGRNAGIETIVVTHGFEDAAILAMAAPDATVDNFIGLLKVADRQAW